MKLYILLYIFYLFYTYAYTISLTLKTSKDPHTISTGNVRDSNVRDSKDPHTISTGNVRDSKDPHTISTGNVRDSKDTHYFNWQCKRQQCKGQQFPLESISSFCAQSFLQNISTLYIMIILQLISNCTRKRNTIRHYIENSLGSIKQFTEASLLIYVTIINIILIVICNCSLLNPRPNSTPVKDSNLKVIYQNVHKVNY